VNDFHLLFRYIPKKASVYLHSDSAEVTAYVTWTLCHLCWATQEADKLIPSSERTTRDKLKLLMGQMKIKMCSWIPQGVWDHSRLNNWPSVET